MAAVNFSLSLQGDLVELFVTGDFNLETTAELLRVIAENRRRHPRTLVLARAALGTIPADARKYAMEWFREHPEPFFAAVYDAGPVVRTLTNMIVRAIALLGVSPLEIRFFATRDQALAWLEEVRRAPPTAG